MSGFDKLVWIIAAVILIPILLSPAGWAFGAVLAVAWLVTAYGGRYLLQLEKQRRQGERGMINDVRMQARRRDR